MPTTPEWLMNDNLVRAAVLRRIALRMDLNLDWILPDATPIGFTVQGSCLAGAEALEALVNEPGGRFVFDATIEEYAWIPAEGQAA